jgi:hypothetical protein
MVGAVDFMNHWRAICKAEANCKGCPLEYSCVGEICPTDFSRKRILALIGEVEKNFEYRKKFGGYPEDGEA